MTAKTELAAKLKRLAEGGTTEDERTNAAAKLDEIMALHGISEADLDDSCEQTYKFKFRGNREYRILQQVAYKVHGTIPTMYDYRKAGRKVNGAIGIDCTPSQRIEIEFLFDFYKVLYEREEAAFLSAFFQKHKLFGESCGKGKTISDDDLRKLHAMMSSMDEASPIRRITAQ